ncbi:unnamed protein product, partial [Ixodes hexagonus]
MFILLEYAMFGTLMTVNLCLGLYFSFFRLTGKVTTDEMFLGSRTLRTIPLGVSVVASIMSALGIVSFTGYHYTYGIHLTWASLTFILMLPFLVYIVIPVFYNLRVVSVFQYVRMRYNVYIELVSCAIYFCLTQSIGALAIFASSVAVSTVFQLPLIWSSLTIGLTGTVYTAMGGLRGVVWTDCMQAAIMLLAPATIIIKIIHDSGQNDTKLGPLSDIPLKRHIFDTSFDITKDENVWSCLVGLFALQMYRVGLDQMIMQRYLAARSLEDAQRTACVGTILMSFAFIYLSVLAMALFYWFRDCDPLLTGEITHIDQLVPFYVNKYLTRIPGFSGVFLAGVVGSSTSTISSLINSQAAICYVDIISRVIRLSEDQATHVTRAVAFAAGIIMTLLSLVVPYLGSASRVMLTVYTGLTGPFVGLILLALNCYYMNIRGGAGLATILTISFQLWHMYQRYQAATEPLRMSVTIDHCPEN